MKNIFSLLAGLSCAGLLLQAAPAQAIVGGAEDRGPLAGASVMLVTPSGMCSAVVVARDAVLTAAHCVADATAYRVHFRDEAGKPVLLTPAAKAVHAGYNAKAVENRRPSVDLALVRISEPLPARFQQATLSGAMPAKGSGIVVGGYGVADGADPKTTGTFRTSPLTSIEPYGQSRILLWGEGQSAGACQGDSGGPMASGTSVVAITSWSSAANGRGCGGVTQGVLVGPQRDWIDKTLKSWGRAAQWE
jgi:hypothetical protein